MYWDMYFRHFVVSFQKFQNHVFFYQEPEPKIPGAGAAPKQAGSETLPLRSEFKLIDFGLATLHRMKCLM